MGCCKALTQVQKVRPPSSYRSEIVSGRGNLFLMMVSSCYFHISGQVERTPPF